jgi:hypothetical protein
VYKNTNPSHFIPHPHQPHLCTSPCNTVYIYIQTPHISHSRTGSSPLPRPPVTFTVSLRPRLPRLPAQGSRLPAPGSWLLARSHPRPRPNAALTPASTITTSPSYPAPPTAYWSAHLPERARALYSQLLIPISVFHAPAFIQPLLAPASGEKSGTACAESVTLDWLRCFEHAVSAG